MNNIRSVDAAASLRMCILWLCCLCSLFSACLSEFDTKPRKRFTLWYTSGQRELWQIIEEFNNSQDSVYCEGSYQGGYGHMMQKLLVAISTGNQPVIAQIEQSLASRVVEYGTVMPLDSLLQADPDLSQEDFIQPILASCIYDDKVYAIPTNASIIILFYNKEIFRRAGLDPDKPPRTWKEVEQYSRIIKQKLGPNYYGMNLHIEDWDLEAFTWQWGGKVMSDNGERTLINERPGLDALKFLRRMVDEELFCITYGKDVYQFFSGQAGMTNKSCAALSWLLSTSSFPDDLGLALYPYEEVSVSPIGGANVYMFKGKTREEYEAAWAFIKFWLSRDVQIRWSLGTGYMVCLESVLNSPEMEERVFKVDPRRRIPYLQLKHSRPRPRFGPYNEINDRAVPIYKSAVDGQNSPERALKLIEDMGRLVIRKYY